MMKGEHRRENSNRKIIRIIKEAFVGTRLAVEERETTAYYYYYPLPTADTTTKGESLVRTTGIRKVIIL